MPNHIEQLRDTLRSDYSALGTWQKVADKYGVNKGVAHRIALSDYEPKKVDIRVRLGLNYACPNCGHIVDIG